MRRKAGESRYTLHYYLLLWWTHNGTSMSKALKVGRVIWLSVSFFPGCGLSCHQRALRPYHRCHGQNQGGGRLKGADGSRTTDLVTGDGMSLSPPPLWAGR